MGAIVTCQHKMLRLRDILLQKRRSSLMLIEECGPDLGEAEDRILRNTLCCITRYE